MGRNIMEGSGRKEREREGGKRERGKVEQKDHWCGEMQGMEERRKREGKGHGRREMGRRKKKRTDAKER